MFACVAIALAACSANPSEPLARCNYEAGLATAGISDQYVQQVKKRDLVAQCMSLKGFQVKAESGSVYYLGVIDNPQDWEQPKSNLEKAIAKKFGGPTKITADDVISVIAVLATIVLSVGVYVMAGKALLSTFPGLGNAQKHVLATYGKLKARSEGAPGGNSWLSLPSRLLAAAAAASMQLVLLTVAFVLVIIPFAFLKPSLESVLSKIF